MRLYDRSKFRLVVKGNVTYDAFSVNFTTFVKEQKVSIKR